MLLVVELNERVVLDGEDHELVAAEGAEVVMEGFEIVVVAYSEVNRDQSIGGFGRDELLEGFFFRFGERLWE